MPTDTDRAQLIVIESSLATLRDCLSARDRGSDDHADREEPTARAAILEAINGLSASLQAEPVIAVWRAQGRGNPRDLERWVARLQVPEEDWPRLDRLFEIMIHAEDHEDSDEKADMGALAEARWEARGVFVALTGETRRTLRWFKEWLDGEASWGMAYDELSERGAR